MRKEPVTQEAKINGKRKYSTEILRQKNHTKCHRRSYSELTKKINIISYHCRPEQIYQDHQSKKKKLDNRYKNSKCRLREVNDIICECIKLTQKEYKNSHDGEGAVIE